MDTLSVRSHGNFKAALVAFSLILVLLFSAAAVFISPDYDRAANKLEITVSSGAGNISIKERRGQAEPERP